MTAYSGLLVPKSHRLELATGLTYHVLEWEPVAGAPADTTFLLVHGFADLAAGWDELADRLAPHGHVLAPDLRGHGDSDWIGAGGYYHFPDYVADLDDVVAKLARRRLIVVGHSMGGNVASYWAGTRPERLAALALLEGLGPPDASGAALGARTARWIDTWKTARGNVVPMASLEEAYARMRKHDPIVAEPILRRLAAAGTREVPGGWAWKQDPLHFTAGPTPFRVEVARQYWQRITCPVLLVDGAESRLNLPLAERAARRAAFANHRHAVLDGAGHSLHRHQPDELHRLLVELVATAG